MECGESWYTELSANRESAMWDQAKQERFESLRAQHDQGALSPEGERELGELIGEIEALEAGYLAKATERAGQEAERLKRRNEALAAVISRKEALGRHLETVLSEVRSEREAIDAELRHILSSENVPTVAKS